MRFVKRVEQFFFPCSKTISSLMAQHRDDMDEFRKVARHAKCMVNIGGGIAAECIVDVKKKDRS